MIPLRLKVTPSGDGEMPTLCRLNRDVGVHNTEYDYYLTDVGSDGSTYERGNNSIRISGADPSATDGDVVLVNSRKGVAYRLIRADSQDNTLVFSETCDENCVMCSQPPKRTGADFSELLEVAVQLAPPNANIGISGGEPTLLKSQLFRLLQNTQKRRPDISFHILSNGQHLDEEDLSTLRGLLNGQAVWGIPLYAANPEQHDAIVRKHGAFERVLRSFDILCRAGAAVELRTVVLKSNADKLPELAEFIATFLPFVDVWALMQLENIGFARKSWRELFFDTSETFGPIAEAICLAAARGIPPVLYNFPLCTVPPEFRIYAPASISDWKRRYLDTCEECSLASRCGGFFEWYDPHTGFSKVVAQ